MESGMGYSDTAVALAAAVPRATEGLRIFRNGFGIYMFTANKPMRR